MAANNEQNDKSKLYERITTEFPSTLTNEPFGKFTVHKLRTFLKFFGVKNTSTMKKEQLLSTAKEQLSGIMNDDKNTDEICFDVVSSSTLDVYEVAPPLLKNQEQQISQNNDQFRQWTVAKLQNYLSEREVNKSSCNKEMLVKLALKSHEMKLEVTAQNIQEYQNEIINDRKKKLVVDNGLITLPSPESLIDGWEEAPINLPDITYDNVKDYLLKNDGGKAFKGGKSLMNSGHLSNVMTHVISPNIRYGFVSGVCVPEQRQCNQSYIVWICVHKDTGDVICGDCGCIAGVGGVCKHVGAVLWFCEKEVREGRNKTCTSKKQTWHVPSKKNQKIHKPDTIRNIHVKKATAVQVLCEENVPETKRFKFDPRAVYERHVESLTEIEIDHLAHITNGNCGIVILSRAESAKCFDYNHVARYEEVLSEQGVVMPKSVREIVSDIIATDEIYANDDEFLVKLQISKSEQESIKNLTAAQSSCDLWHKFRADRVTASIFKTVADKVTNDNKVRNPNKVKTAVMKVCGYSRTFQSKATSWGISNEPVARSSYLKKMKKIHKKMIVKESGFVVNLDYPFIGASPDGVVSCECHGVGLLEIKCPWTSRGCTIDQYSKIKDSCLAVIDGTIKLKPKHMYYYQVQCQMATANLTWCDFVVCTTKNMHIERINFDSGFWGTMAHKCLVFYKDIIVPELFSRQLEQDIQLGYEVKSVIDILLDKVSST